MRVKRIDKLNQKGMTLIEVVVAMAILAVVITPTLRIFASTSGTNLRSRQRQRATSVAEGIMESFKAYNMESLCRQFGNGSFAGVVHGTDFNMYVKAVYGPNVVENEVDALYEDYFTLKDDADAYNFYITNAASEGQLYDAKITVTPVIAPVVLKRDDANKYSDAIITLQESTAYDAVDKLEEQAETMLEDDITAEDLEVNTIELSDFKRVIDITVNDNSGASQTVVLKVTYTAEAEVNYQYTSVGGTATDTATYDVTYETVWGDADSGETEWTVYNNEDTIGGEQIRGVTNCKLNQIFLYYFPVYKSAFGDGASDEINISGNLSGLYNSASSLNPEVQGYQPLRVIVAKQYPLNVTGADLDDDEVVYNVTLTSTVTGGGDVELWHNYNENFTSSGESVIAVPTILGFTTHEKLEDVLADRVVLLYDVKIEVFEAGSTDDPVAVFEGTMNE